MQMSPKIGARVLGGAPDDDESGLSTPLMRISEARRAPRPTPRPRCARRPSAVADAAPAAEPARGAPRPRSPSSTLRCARAARRARRAVRRGRARAASRSASRAAACARRASARACCGGSRARGALKRVDHLSCVSGGGYGGRRVREPRRSAMSAAAGARDELDERLRAGRRDALPHAGPHRVHRDLRARARLRRARRRAQDAAAARVRMRPLSRCCCSACRS